MKEILSIVSIILAITLLGYGVLIIGDYLDRPSPKLQQEYRQEQDTKIKWFKDQGGRPQFDEYNKYRGCK